MRRFWFLFLTGVLHACAFAQPIDLSGSTDDSIRNVLKVVADRQLRTSASGSTPRVLTDGNYPIVTTIGAAQSVAKPGGIEWNYPWGVNLYGLLQVYRATGNTNYLNFVLKHNLIVGRYYFWLRSLHNSLTSTNGLSTFQQSTALRETFLNDTSSGMLDYCGSATSQMMEGILRYSDAMTFEQMQFALNSARYISTKQARLPDGTLYRSGSIWADDLYMSCPFLVRWYEYSGDTNFLDDAVRQISNIAGYLQETNGIWYHGYYTASAKVNGIKWGRANGWAMVATCEVLDATPTNHPGYSNVLNILRRHIEGIIAVQQPSGRWRQILDYDNASNWEETSCTAMYSYCIAHAVNRGWIDATNMAFARKGFQGVCQSITTNGVVNGTVQGTGMSTNPAYYLGLSKPIDDMHGRGAVMMAGAEILLHPQMIIVATGGNVDLSWPAGLRRCSLETTTNFVNWLTVSTPPAITQWTATVSETQVDAAFYRLQLEEASYGQVPLIYEAETLAWTTNGAAALLSGTDTNASGNLYVVFYGDGIGDHIEFTITNVPAGTYRLKMNFRANANRGFVNLSVDGSATGGVLDEYFYSTLFPLMDFGPLAFAADGDHTLRFTIGGKHGASTGFTFTADRILLEPQ